MGMSTIAVYELENPEDTYASDAKIEHLNLNGHETFSCSDRKGSFHFINNTLRGSKMSFAREFSRDKKIKWKKVDN